MNKFRSLIVLLVAGLLLVGCGSKDGNTGTGKAGDSSLSDPKGSIAYQFELLKAGDADKLRACFTERLRDSITKERVDKASAKVGQLTMDDLWAASQEGEYDGKKTTKVKMKNGRTLTTLVLTDGKWLSDTIWFD
jgi:hypothetical protein